MSDEIEKVTIKIESNCGDSVRIVTDEYDVSNTCWPHLVEVFLEQLQGLGYKFVATPEEMVDVLEEFHQELMSAECGGCEEEKPVVEENKYPYNASFTENGKMFVVRFTEPNKGSVIMSSMSERPMGYYSFEWAEEDFVPCL